VEFLKELFAHVFSSLLRNKLRSILTMAGIAWGVASMVLIVAMGDGFKGGQRDRFRDIGENIVIVFNGRTELQPGGRRAGRTIRLDYDDVREIRANCYLVRTVVAELQSGANAVSPFNSGTFRVLGVEPEYSEIRNIPVDRGRFLVAADDADGARVAVLGDNVRIQ
jgi:putative ABC transport system permease protein